MNVDHIVELQLGGEDLVYNLQLLDASINSSIGRRIQNAIQAAGLKEGDLVAGIRWKGVEWW